MGTNSAVRQPVATADEAEEIVAFDFDGTLTCRDSFVAFLVWRAGPVRFLAGMASLAPALVRHARSRDRDVLKAAVARRFLGGLSRLELEAAAEQFAGARFEALMRPDALACWREWRARGARLLIVTASPEFLVAPFARRLGADQLIATRLDFDSRDRFTGRLDGRNCRGPQKTERLRAAYGPGVALAAAYGDSDGDREMLALTDRPGLKVFTARP
jgi:phosphatidylglycerophosphatase C